MPQPVREKTIERYFIKQAQKRGWIAYKFTSPGRRSVPDRFVVRDDGMVFFCELKRPGKKPSPKQYKELDKLKRLNQRAYWADTKERVDEIYELEDLL